MATKLLETDFENGRFANRVDGISPVLDNVKILDGKDGFNLSAINYASPWYINFPTISHSATGDFSYCVSFYNVGQGPTFGGTVIGNAGGGGPGSGITYHSGTINCEIQGSLGGRQILNLKTIRPKEKTTVGVRINRATRRIEWWINGVKGTTAQFTDPGNIIEGAGDIGLVVGNPYGGSFSNFRTYIKKAQVWNGLADYSEFEKQHKWYMKQSAIKKPIRNNYPRPNVVSDKVILSATNIISNGTFDINTTGWIFSRCSGVASGGECVVTISSGTLEVVMQQNSILTVGGRYKIKFRARSSTISAGFNLGAYMTNVATINNPNMTSVTQDYEFEGTALYTYFIILLPSSLGNTLVIDNIEVYQYTGLLACYNGTLINGKAINIASPSLANGNNPSAYNATCTKTLPTISGIFFPGTTSNINCGNPGIFSASGNGELSMNFRLTQQEASESNKYLYYKQGSTYEISAKFDVGILSLYAYKSDGSANAMLLNTTNKLNALKETTITILIKSTSINTGFMKVYYDGVLEAQTLVQNHPILGGTGNLVLMERPGIGGNKCILKDFRFYNRILSETEIKKYHNSFCKPAIVECFCNYPEGAFNLDYNWIPGTGRYKVGVNNPDAKTNLALNPNFAIDTSNWGPIGDLTITRITGDGPTSIITTCGEMSSVTGTINNMVQENLSTISSAKRYIGGFWAKSVSGNTTLRQQNLSPGGGPWILTTSRQYFTFNQYGTSPTTNRFYLDGPGVFRITGMNIVEYVDPIIKKGQKYLECTTAGPIALPCNIAYGTYEWSMYKGSDGATTEIYFQSPSANTNGYYYLLKFDTAEAIYFGKSGLQLSKTANAYIQNNTWYRIRVTRNYAGVFTIYIKGGTFTNWTQVVMASGTNPITDNTYTRNNFIAMYLTAGDRITDIVVTPRITV